VSGAVREGNSQKRHQGFESGNWQGQLLAGELKFYDSVYHRSYEPDAVKDFREQVKGSRSRHLESHLEQEPYQALGEKHPNPDVKFKQLLRKRFKQADKNPAFRNNKYP